MELEELDEVVEAVSGEMKAKGKQYVLVHLILYDRVSHSMFVYIVIKFF